jgi:sulfide:quinone oxidoreductase
MHGEPSQTPLQVVIAGGGVAGLEAALALRDLAGDLVAVTLVTATDRFTFAPASVGAPFGRSVVRHFDLAEIARDLGANLVIGSVEEVDADRRRVILTDRSPLPYHAVLVACGVTARPAVPGAVTFGGPGSVEEIGALLGETLEGRVRRLLFVVPSNVGWTLPLYELCLLTREHLEQRGRDTELGLVTPEATPLAAFGEQASRMVAANLRDRGIAFHGMRTPVRLFDGFLETRPGEYIEADRVVALPRLSGVRIDGLPVDSDGFVRTDAEGRVGDYPDVYAAGDITAFPIKQGGIAAQQAVAAARSIAADAGADVAPQPFDPVLRGLLLGGPRPAYLRAEVQGGRGAAATVDEQPLWWPPGKLAAHYLGPYLAELDAR